MFRVECGMSLRTVGKIVSVLDGIRRKLARIGAKRNELRPA